MRMRRELFTTRGVPRALIVAPPPLELVATGLVQLRYNVSGGH